MAIVSGYTLSDEQIEEFRSHIRHAEELRVWEAQNLAVGERAESEGPFDLVVEPDGHVTVGCLVCHEILIDFYPEGE